MIIYKAFKLSIIGGNVNEKISVSLNYAACFCLQQSGVCCGLRLFEQGA